jgi:hypothetical protein
MPPPVPPPPVNYQGGPIPRVSGLSDVWFKVDALFYRSKVCLISEVFECESNAQLISHRLGVCMKVSFSVYSFCRLFMHCAV